MLPLQTAGRLELRFRVVDADDLCPAASEPRGDVRGPAPQLDHVLPRDVVRDHAQVRLGYVPDAPSRRILRPMALARSRVVTGQRVPVSTVLKHVVRQGLTGQDATSRG